MVPLLWSSWCGTSPVILASWRWSAAVAVSTIPTSWSSALRTIRSCGPETTTTVYFFEVVEAKDGQPRMEPQPWRNFLDRPLAYRPGHIRLPACGSLSDT